MLNIVQRKTLVTILIEVGKFTTVGMVIGYFVSPRPIAAGAAIAGVLFALCCFVVAVLISKEVSYGYYDMDLFIWCRHSAWCWFLDHPARPA